MAASLGFRVKLLSQAAADLKLRCRVETGQSGFVGSAARRCCARSATPSWQYDW